MFLVGTGMGSNPIRNHFYWHTSHVEKAYDVLSFQLWYRSDVAEGQVGAQVLEAHQHTFYSNLKTRFKQSLDQNTHKTWNL